MDRPEVRERLTEVRAEELAASAAAIGFDEVIMLGYRDSGMPDTPPNEHPDAFANAPFMEAVERLVTIIRTNRPDVIITYADDQQGYQHPDHLRVHDITLPAFDLAVMASAFPDAGAPWTPKKLYYSMWSRRRMLATHMKMQELEVESPFDEKWFSRPSMDHRLTTRIDIHDTFSVRREALLAHRTQVDPESPFWFGLPEDVAREVYPYEDYILARTRVAIDRAGARSVRRYRVGGAQPARCAVFNARQPIVVTPESRSSERKLRSWTRRWWSSTRPDQSVG